MRIAVTGAAGHLGANLIPHLAAAGHDPVAIDIRCPDWPGVDCHQIDILDTGRLQKAFGGCDVVIHLASKISVVGDPDGSVWKTNVLGARSTAQAASAAGARRLVHMSSIHAFDVAACPDGIDEDSPRSHAGGLPAYDRSKAAGEGAVRAAAAETGIELVVLNPTGVVGPNDAAPSRMGRVFLAMRDARMRGLTTGAFDWVDVRDVAAATEIAATSAPPGGQYILAGHLASIPELAQLVAEVTGAPIPKPTVPLGLVRPIGPVATRLARRRGEGLLPTSEALRALRHPPVVVTTRARDELNHQPRPLRRTVTDVFASFQKAGL